MTIKFSRSLPEDLIASHCPCCGRPLDVIQQEFHYKEHHRCFKNYTCWNEKCQVYGRTCSNLDLITPEVLDAWEATQRFDVFSGLALETEQVRL